MRKIYLSCILLLTTFCSFVNAQSTTITTTATTNTFWSASGGAIVFGVRNTNGFPIKLTGLSNYCPANHTSTYTLWYNTTTLTGVPNAITTTNNWIQLPITYTVPSTATAGITPIFSNIDLTIPAGVIYRLALVASVNGPYYGSSGAGPDIFSGGGVDILTQGNTASQTYVGPITGPTSTPRGFFGSLTFEPAAPCSNPFTAGNTVSNFSNVCAASTFGLSLSGSSGLGTGTTFQWQNATASTGPWNNISSATNSILNTTQSTSTWYRCAIQCSGGSVAYSTPLQVTSPPLIPTSSFTVNKNLPSSSTNFQSFTEAFEFIKCGINGAITFTVTPGSGPYTEQVQIPVIGGASSTNRVTIKGNNENLTFTPTVATSRHVLWLNGADHITIDSLNVTVGGTVAGWGIVLTNQADSNRISNCTVDVGNPTSTSTNFIPIVINGSNNTTASTGNNGNYNIIEKNTLLNGSNGFYLYGNTASTTQNVGNIFRNNIVKEFYGYGVSALYASEGTLISKNDFSRPTRTNSTTTGGVSLGTGCRGVLVEKNRVHNLFDAFLTSTSAAYGVFVSADAVVGVENKIINNAFYAYNGNGIHYGVGNSGGDHMQAYHNTVVMNYAAATGAAYGLHQTTLATGVVFKNNIVSITKGGTGAKRGVAFVTITSSITSNSNVFFFNPSGGTDNHLGQYGAATATFADLTSWKTANSSAFDQLSLSLDPSFVDPNNGDLAFTNQTIDAKGENLGVTRDIVDSLRGIAPDPGCYELSFLVSGIDMVADALVNPANNINGCYTNVETASVRIKNNSSATINFATNPCTVAVQVTGAATQTITHIVNSGTLASDSFLLVTLPSTLNLSTIGGYSINATATVTGDVNTSNNALSTPVTREKIGLNAGTVSATPSSFCAVGGNQPVLRTTSPTGHSSLKWQSSTTSNGTFTDIVGATTNPFTTTAPFTQTMYYRAVTTCGTQTNNAVEDTVEYINPQILSTTPGTACGTGTVVLGATSSVGTTINWYANAVGGTPLGTGTSFTTPIINSTTTYYVNAGLGSATINMPSPTIGTSTFITTSAGWGLRFTANNAATISTVQISALNTAAGNATIQINVTDLNDVVVYNGTVHNFAIGTSLATYTIPVNITVAPGNYKMVMTYSGISNMVRESSGLTFPYTSSDNSISITAGSNGVGTAQTTAAYYWFYNWVLGGGCEGTRTAVVATITSAPSITTSTTKSVICNGSTTTLNVNSSNTNYAYTWSPLSLTGSSVNASPITTTKYYVNALDATTNCRSLDSVTINVQPTITSAVATPAAFCITGGTASLSVAPTTGYAPNSLQWQTSNNNIAFNDISGANATTYATPTINATTYYKVQAKDIAGVVCNAQDVVVEYKNPQILTTTPRYTCGTGTVTLSATGSLGTTINWYAAASGGVPLGSGLNFTTPTISTTTTYYAAANSGSGGMSTIGRTAALSSATSGSGTTNFGLVFDALVPFTLYAVDLYPIASTAGTAGTVTIDVIDANGTVLNTATVNVVGNPLATALTVPQTVILNFNIAVGTNLKLRHSARSSTITGLLFEPAASAPSGNYGYPFSVPGVVNVITSTLTATPTNTARNDLYYYFYNLQIVTGCESARTPVIATVDNTPGCTPLPVYLLQFSGTKDGLVNKLQFTTANETNNKGFYIERSADGYKFSNIGYVATKAVSGSSRSNIAYNFIDEKPLAGNNYYRLKQEDKDGKTTLSNVVAIKGKLVNKIEIDGLYPNPANNQLTIQLSTPTNEKVTMVITDLQGKIVQQQPVNIASGNNNVHLNISNLSSGNYFIKAICNNGCNTTIHKFVKL